MAMTFELTAASSAAVPRPQNQLADSEPYSRTILGPVQFEMSHLRVEGIADDPIPPEFMALGQSPYIIASDEMFNSSVNLKFNRTPLSSLLMGLETQITINFHYEGQGKTAPDVDLPATIATQKDEYEYGVKLASLPIKVGLTPGLYIVSATAEIGPVGQACSQCIMGYGYIAKVLLQVY